MKSSELEVPSTHTEHAPIDIAVLAKLVGNDPLVHIKLLEGFLLSTTQIIEELESTWQSQSISVISGLFHKLKSSTRSVGAKALGDMCEAMEMAGKAGNWSKLKELKPRFNDMSNEVIEYLKTHLNDKKAS
jgi:HPt (histidine-containing phosphotransfer) domain-containing protein